MHTTSASRPVPPTADASAASEGHAPSYKLRRQTTGAFALFHALLPLAAVPWFFSWEGLAALVVGNYLFGGLGVCLGYHRILTHRSLKVPKWLEYTLAIFGICTLEDSPAHWVAIHRVHHKHSDEDADPHTPLKSLLWAHIGWLFFKRRESNKHRDSLIHDYTPDLMREPFYRFLEQGNMWIWVFAAHAVLFFLAGVAIGWLRTAELMSAVQLGLSVLLWGVVVRVVLTWHFTWSVNSVAHRWGYRNYETRDNSQNNWLVAMVTWGEGWHNNHHADQRSAAHGHCWWEFDATFATIRVLQMLGLATDVVPPRCSTPATKRVRQSALHTTSGGVD